MRSELPTDLPDRMRGLPLDHRGYPVPWFVAWLDEDENETLPPEGKPEFRCMSQLKLARAVKEHRCWVCGGRLGRYRAFVIGPMCLVNLINAEPPSHLDCADWSARACPFLTRPHMVRRENALPEEISDAGGISIRRNPGVSIVYVCDSRARVKSANGVVFELPMFTQLRFYAEGRPATYEEVEAAVEGGLPELLKVCRSNEERAEVHALRDGALAVVRRAIGPSAAA